MGLLLVQRLCACGVTRHRRNFCARRSEAVNPKSFVFQSYLIHISILFLKKNIFYLYICKAWLGLGAVHLGCNCSTMQDHADISHFMVLLRSFTV